MSRRREGSKGRQSEEGDREGGRKEWIEGGLSGRMGPRHLPCLGACTAWQQISERREMEKGVEREKF